MLARAMLLASLVVLTSSGCGSPGAGQGEANDGEDEASDYASERPKRGRVKDKDDVSEKGKSWGGWRWKGDRNNCVYVFDNKCFTEKEPACKEAGCDEKSCLVKEGAPSKVKCPKDDE